MFVIHETLPNKTKLKKIIQCPSINLLLFDMVVVFSLKYIQLCIYCSKIQKTFFFSEISSKNFKFLKDHRFNSRISISYTIKKIHPEIPLTTLVLKYVCIFFKFCNKYYFVTNILHTFKFFIFCWILKKN